MCCLPVSQQFYTPERIVWKPETVPSDFAKAVKKEQMSPHSRCVSREPLGFQYSFLILGHNRQPLTMPFGIIRESRNDPESIASGLYQTPTATTLTAPSGSCSRYVRKAWPRRHSSCLFWISQSRVPQAGSGRAIIHRRVCSSIAAFGDPSTC